MSKCCVSSCRLLMPRFTAAVPVVACLLFIFVMATLLRTAFSDPGIIPRATPHEAADTEKHIGIVTGTIYLRLLHEV